MQYDIIQYKTRQCKTMPDNTIQFKTRKYKKRQDNTIQAKPIQDKPT